MLTLTVWPTRSPSWRSTEPPSAIWPAVAGGRPVSTVEDVIGPVPGARPIAGITVVPMVTVPCTPYVMSVMPGTCPVIWVNCFGVTAPNWPSNAMFQSWPYRLGVPTRRSRFAPNVPAPATAATATARPSMALRTGTLGAARSRVEREPYAGGGGERHAGPRQAFGEQRAAPRRLRDVRGGARPGLPPRGHRDAGGEQHHDRGRPGGENAGVHADAGMRLG